VQSATRGVGAGLGLGLRIAAAGLSSTAGAVFLFFGPRLPLGRLGEGSLTGEGEPSAARAQDELERVVEVSFPWALLP